MPRYAGYNRGSRLFAQGGATRSGRDKMLSNYKKPYTTVRRHEYLAGAPSVGTPLTLSGEDYLLTTIARFRRSFGAGSDDLPTPTVGNNYQTPDVMNGSRIENVKFLARMTNKSNADPLTLTVYKYALSFYDVHTWNALFPSGCPFTFSTAATDEGEIVTKAVTASACSENTILNRKFLQHYHQKVGEITLGQEGSGKETVEFQINGIPSKCKRSNVGMYYGVAFVNDSDKNEGRTVSMDYSQRIHFDEIPSEARLSWLS